MSEKENAPKNAEREVQPDGTVPVLHAQLKNYAERYTPGPNKVQCVAKWIMHVADLTFISRSTFDVNLTVRLQGAKALPLSEDGATQKYVMLAGGYDKDNKEERVMLSALPFTSGGKNRDRAKDLELPAGHLFTIDRCPKELFIAMDLTAFMETGTHR